MRIVRWLGVALLSGCAADSEDRADGGALSGDDATGMPTDDDGDDGDPGEPGDPADPADPADPGGSGDDGEPGDTNGAADDAGPVAEPPPTDAEALTTWLSAGTHLSWPAESAPHPSAGPHFGTVRTFVNEALFASLSAGNAEHPEGAAAVKELYGNGDQVLGWSVMVKVAVGAGDDGWYWYEMYDGSVFGDDVGDDTCTGCHGTGDDYVRTPFPLQ